MSASKKYYSNTFLKEKECSKCRKILPFFLFSNMRDSHDGKQKKCKSCNLKYRKINRDKHIKYLSEYYKKNKEKFIEKNYKYQKNKLQKDLFYKFKKNYFNRVRSFRLKHKIKRNSDSIKKKREDRFYSYFGLNDSDFMLFISKKFSEGMTWDNYGEWHIDHIIPLSIAKTDDEVKELCRYENLRPCWPKENMSKNRFVNEYYIAMTEFNDDIKNKYRMRLGIKPEQPVERDLEKAKWYEDKAMELKKR